MYVHVETELQRVGTLGEVAGSTSGRALNGEGVILRIRYNGGTVLLLYYSGYTHATILLRYLSALLDKF
jgi:hypothetical protein